MTLPWKYRFRSWRLTTWNKILRRLGLRHSMLPVKVWCFPPGINWGWKCTNEYGIFNKDWLLRIENDT